MAVRNADDILIGGGRVFIVEEGDNNAKEYYDLGYMSGEFKVEEQASSQTVKESEGGTVLTIATDKEVHLTCNILECNTDTLLKINPSATEIGGTGDNTSDGKGYAVGSYQSDKTFQLELWHKKRSGNFRCVRFFKAKLSGNIPAFLVNQDNENPIALDFVGLADETRDTDRNIYEQFEVAKANVATKVPNGGW